MEKIVPVYILGGLSRKGEPTYYFLGSMIHIKTDVTISCLKTLKRKGFGKLKGESPLKLT
jgi:hypothetical protein